MLILQENQLTLRSMKSFPTVSLLLMDTMAQGEETHAVCTL